MIRCDNRRTSAISPVSCFAVTAPKVSPTVNVGSPMDSSNVTILGETRRLLPMGVKKFHRHESVQAHRQRPQITRLGAQVAELVEAGVGAAAAKTMRGCT